MSVSDTDSESDAFPLVDSALALGSPEFLTDSLEKNTPSVICLLTISQLASFLVHMVFQSVIFLSLPVEPT